jgi:O-succinylbenzoic acid--CoA ligase
MDSSMNPVDAGNHGEIVVDGPMVTEEYYDNQHANNQSYSQHGFHTGDTGYIDQHGRLWVTGRIDDEIITGGKNVHPREIKTVITNHPKVSAAFVTGVDDDEWGERVSAVVVPREPLSKKELREYCREELADFKIPRNIEFVSSLPRTQSGTAVREAIREILMA